MAFYYQCQLLSVARPQPPYSVARPQPPQLIKKPAKEERFRIYAGYAGWAPKQLESELDRGNWHVLKADTETLFDKKASDIWQDLIQQVSVKWVRTINSGKLSGRAGRP